MAAVWFSATFMLFLVVMLGFVTYDYYSVADPMVCGKICKGDQVMINL